MPAQKHDIWNKCGHPDTLINVPKPTEPFKRTRMTTKELAESHCACCGGELIVLIGYDIATTSGVVATISCPTCTSAELAELQNRLEN